MRCTLVSAIHNTRIMAKAIDQSDRPSPPVNPPPPDEPPPPPPKLSRPRRIRSSISEGRPPPPSPPPEPCPPLRGGWVQGLRGPEDVPPSPPLPPFRSSSSLPPHGPAMARPGNGSREIMRRRIGIIFCGIVVSIGSRGAEKQCLCHDNRIWAAP